jgi:hypothetical protein
MEQIFTRQDLAALVQVVLDGTGIDPEKTRIDCVMPDVILSQYDPKDVVEVAVDNRFVAELCPTCLAVRVNGKWIPAEKDLVNRASAQGRFHSTCDRCYAGYVNKIHEFY